MCLVLLFKNVTGASPPTPPFWVYTNVWHAPKVLINSPCSPTINIKRNCTIEGERLVRSMSCKYFFLKEPMVLNFIYFINVIEPLYHIYKIYHIYNGSIICFAQSPPLLSYIPWPKVEVLYFSLKSSILGNLNRSQLFSAMEQSNWLIAKQKIGLVRHPQHILKQITCLFPHILFSCRVGWRMW
jgi:hypothetical protein